jgi:glutathione synthase/RimK-type ligase-like ATP-grasp enzyme
MKTMNRVHTLGICAMSKKVNTKHMQKILKNIKKFEEFKLINFTEDLIFEEDIEKWPIVESMIVFFSTGFPFNKVLEYIKLRKPFLVNDFESQKIFWDRRKIVQKLKENNIPTPESIIIDRGEIINNDGDNDTSIELNTTAERIKMIDDYFNDKENNLLNDINDYKKINKNDFNFNNYWNESLSKNNFFILERVNGRDSLFNIDKTYSNGSMNMLKLSLMKNRLSNINSISKNS